MHEDFLDVGMKVKVSGIIVQIERLGEFKVPTRILDWLLVRMFYWTPRVV